MKENKKSNLSCFVVLSMYLVLVFCTAVVFYNIDKFPGFLTTVNDNSWNENWKTDNRTINLPFCFESDVKEVVMTKLLPESLAEDSLLVIDCSCLPIKAEIDGKQLEVTGSVFDGVFGLNYANSHSVVKIPDDAEGKTIKLIMSSEGSKNSIEVYKIFLGADASIRANSLDDAESINLLGLLLIIIAVLLIIISFIFQMRHMNANSSEIILVAVFVLLSALWFMTDSGQNSVMYGSNRGYFFISLFVYLMLALPFELLLERICGTGKKIISFITIVATVIILGFMILMCFGCMKLSLIHSISRVLYAIIILTDFICVARDVFFKKNKEILPIFIGLIILSLSGVASLINTCITKSPSSNSFFKYGIIIFAIILMIWVIRYITNLIGELRAIKEREYSAGHDGLTGIYNRFAFSNTVVDLIEKNRTVVYAVGCFDFERFRLINATIGHEEGDNLLKYTSETLSVILKGKGVYARMDSDKYLVCLQYSEKSIDEFCSKLQEEIKKFTDRISLTLSFGWFVVNDRSLNIDNIVDRSICARAKIKGQYRGRIAFYDEELRRRELYEQEISDQIVTAIEENQFKMHLQPKYDLATEKANGFEALVRWKKGPNGFVSPADFVPIFEKNGLIPIVDEYIWRCACRTLREWIDKYGEDKVLSISVNVSRVDIYNPNLVDNLIALVEEYNLDPRLLPLEITESACSDDLDGLIVAIDALRKYGFPIHMDDFGSGYSSLNMLRDVTVDAIKIDLKFLYDIDNNEKAITILKGVMDLAKSMNTYVIAEGVESIEQAEILKSFDCEAAQGYLYSRPIAQELAEEIVASGNTTKVL